MIKEGCRPGRCDKEAAAAAILVLDNRAPEIAAGLLVDLGNLNSNPGVYDPLGRMFFAGLTAKF